MVRSLGRRGLRVVVIGEYESISVRSRYCAEAHQFSALFDDSGAGVKFLKDLAAREATPPVLFPTADPDLVFISRHRDELGSSFRLFVSSEEIVENLINKGKFFDFANRFDLPTPKTSSLNAQSDVRAIVADYEFPVILKPLVPQNWGNPKIKKLVAGKKAVLAQTPEELVELHKLISELDDRLALQEYIPGRDDRLFSLHAYISQEGEVIGAFTGQKIRTCPAYAGIGCYVTSVDKPDLKKIGLDMLQRIGYRGLALAQFKQHAVTGEYCLLEINPRLSSWNMLATACDVDLPYAAWCDCAGTDMQRIEGQTEGLNYLYLEHDLSAMREYVRKGDLSYREWFSSVIRSNTFQHFAWDDLRPFWYALRRWIARQFSKIG